MMMMMMMMKMKNDSDIDNDNDNHNQLLMTTSGRILCLTRKWRQKCSLLQVNAPLTEKTWGRG